MAEQTTKQVPPQCEAPSADIRARLEAYLDGGAWQVAPDREQTRRALIDTLAAMPAATVELLFQVNRLLVIAPPRHSDAATYAFRFQASGEGVETMVVFLDQRIEARGYEDALREIRKQFALACTRLAGLNNVQAAQVAIQEATLSERKPS
jgi:hypothetical protein